MPAGEIGVAIRTSPTAVSSPSVGRLVLVGGLVD